MNKKILLALAALALLTATAAAVLATTSVEAKKRDKPVKAKIEWSQQRVNANIDEGETFQTTLTFTPTTNVTNAEFRITASLNDTVTVEPSSFASLTAGAPQQVTVTFTAPTESKRQKYHGIMALIDEKYLYAKPLKLRFDVNK
jgi:hypothetical protein